MAIRALILGLVAMLFVAICSPLALLGQFLEPTKDELQMTADPKAPGADAVYLNREDVTDLVARTRTFYERSKVLTEKGKELATINMPYEPGSEKIDVVGRTIHADGTIIPLIEKPSDLVDLKTKGLQLDTLVFTLPDAQIGSILEYRVIVHHSRFGGYPTWMIQRDYFVHKAHYVFKTAGYFVPDYISRLGKTDAKVVDNRKGTYTLDLTDIPALPNEDWMPPINAYIMQVSFLESWVTNLDVFWNSAQLSWATFVLEFISPTSALKKAASEIVAPGDSEMEKAKKIYAAVMKLENTGFTRTKSQKERKQEKIKDIHNAQDVWKDQRGTPQEIALLFVALCRAAGLNVGPMTLVDRSRAIFDKAMPDRSQFDDYIAFGQIDGKDMYFDPGEKMCPFGMIHWKHTLTWGFRLLGTTSKLTRTPFFAPDNSYVQRTADLAIDESGHVQGTVRFALSGQEALYWRQVALENDPDEVKKQFNEWVRKTLPEGVDADFDHFLGIDDYNSTLHGIVKVSGILGTVTGKRIFLPGLFFESNGKHPFVSQEKRTTPVDVHYPRLEQDEVTYRMPAGFAVESSPKVTQLSWPDHASLSITTTPEAGDIQISRKLSYSYALVDAKDYGSLYDFYQKVAAADQQQTILARIPNTTGK